MILHFDVERLRSLVYDAEKRIVEGVTPQPLYGQETGPGFWMVGDQGVYLMDNLPFPEGQETAEVCYADEVNPKTMEFDDWYDNKRLSFGGDDGVDFVPLLQIKDLVEIARLRGQEKVSCNLTPNNFSLFLESA